MTIADAATSETLLFIGGDWRGGRNDEWMDVVDPATGSVFGRLALASDSDLSDAADAAVAGFEVWSAMSAYERSAILRRAADIVRANKEDIARALTREQGKPLDQSRGEIAAAADIIDWLAEEGRRLYGRVIPSRSPDVTQITLRLPVGPVAAFTPWNFPVNQVVRKLGAALAAGCSIIVKAPEETPAAPAALIRAFEQAGVPSGTVNLVFGDPARISNYLIAHPAIRKISFTGSTPVGKHLASLAGQHMKRATMELGGHAPALVFADGDIDAAVKVLSAGKFRNAGQVCVSPTRLLVEAPVFERFTDAFVKAAQAVRVGNGLVPKTEMGPLANERRVEAIEGLVRNALEKGAELRTGGRRIGNTGNFFEPTVLVNVPCSARVMNEEPFGPIAVINPFNGLSDALAEANRLPFGLASYAFTGSTATAHALAIGIEAGMTTINHNGLALPEVPFGGIKDSGYGSEGGTEAIEPYVVTKFVSIRA